MKTNAIVRIVIFSIVIFILLGILLAGLGFGLFSFVVDTDSDAYQVSSVPVVCLDPSGLQKIQVDWVAGSVRVVAADVDEITFSESGYTSDSNKMVWKQTGSTLNICYRRPGLQIGFFHEPSKDLTISVPRDWSFSELGIDTVSGDVTLSGLTGSDFELDCVSAKGTLTQCSITNVDISTVSGDVSYEGQVQDFACDGVSARCELYLEGTAREIEMDCVSGDLYLYVPEDFGFTVDVDSASGDFQTEFETIMKNKSYVYGDGSCQIDASTASGDIRIQKKP